MHVFFMLMVIHEFTLVLEDELHFVSIRHFKHKIMIEYSSEMHLHKNRTRKILDWSMKVRLDRFQVNFISGSICVI